MHDKFSDGPSKDFERNIREHLDDHRGECPEVRCSKREPDICDLDDAQLKWYLHWRDLVFGGSYLNTDEGYFFILFSEIIVRDLEPSKVREICEGLIGIARYDKYDDIGEFLFDYQIAHGVDPDFPIHRKGFRREDCTAGALANILAYPQSDIPPILITLIAEHADSYLNLEEAYELAPDYNKAIRAVGELLHSRGTGILEEFGDGRVSYDRSILVKYPTYKEERTYILDHTSVGLTGRMDWFLAGMYRLTVKTVRERNGGKGPSVPGYITKDMRKVVKSALEGKASFDDGIGKVPDMRFTRLSDHMMREDLILIPQLSHNYKEPGTTLRDSIIQYADAKPGPHMEYIPSNIPMPEHSKLTRGRLEYFIQWREDVRNGIYGKTDNGYIWLLMTELLNHGDPKESLDIMLGLRDAYDPYHQDDGMGKGILFHALAHHLDIPSTDLSERDPYCIAKVLTQMNLGRGGEITLGSYEYIVSRVSKSPVPGFDRACADAMNAVINKASRMKETENEGPNVISGLYLDTDVLLKNNTPYKFYGFPGKDRSFKMCLRSIDERYTCEYIRGMMEEYAGMMQDIRAGKEPKMRSPFYGRINIEKVAVETCKISAGKASAGKVAETRRDVSIDKDAVKKAQNDLEKVTDMMSVDDDAEPKTVISEEEPKVVPEGDPWVSLVSSLTDEERAFIGSLMTGDRDGRQVRLVDSINSKAMDTVGDVLIDDGILIGDYTDNIRNLLGTSDPYSELIDSLTDEEKGYVIALVSGPKPKGRRPVKRIESINSKASRILGSELIIDGSIAETHIGHISKVI